MQYGINVPNFGVFADPLILVTLAREAEDAGWDGFFIWDHMLVDASWTLPIGDPWVALSAIAATTERIRLGPMVAALPRRRPWKVARETAGLDILSGGRLILGVGLGWPSDADFAHFGDEGDVRRRAEMLDEELAILVGLWSGRPFSFEGRNYRLGQATFLPTPVQQPRIPIWVAALQPGPALAAAPGTTVEPAPEAPPRPAPDAPLRRAARWDGIFPATESVHVGAAEMRAIADRIATLRGPDAGPFDIVAAGETPGDDPTAAEAILTPFREAGATWWQEQLSEWRGPLDDLRARVRRGPPPG